MNLIVVRQKFVEITGRYDLVVDDTNWADNGADFYITEANKELYRDQDILPNNMEVKYTVPAGSQIFPIPNLITMEGLYYIDSAGDKKIITTMTDKEFKYNYPGARRGALIQDKASFTESTKRILFSDDNPIALGFHAGMNIRISDSVSNNTDYIIASVTATQILTTTALVTEGEVDCNIVGYFGTPGSPEYARYMGLNISGQAIVNVGNIGIYFNVPFDSEITLFVEGLFLDALSADTDESYWSIKAPMLLIAQSCWFLEMTYRNTTGMNDWKLAINEMKGDIESQFSELTTRDINQMKEAY